jgi:hypothetical protein
MGRTHNLAACTGRLPAVELTRRRRPTGTLRIGWNPLNFWQETGWTPAPNPPDQSARHRQMAGRN